VPLLLAGIFFAIIIFITITGSGRRIRMALTNNILLLILVGLSGFFDAKVRRIPNKITFPAILFGLVIGLITGGWLGLFQSFLLGCWLV
jgi:hypothetical protein